jgi:hypothetical protein
MRLRYKKYTYFSQLESRLPHANWIVALIDCDVGQTCLGRPTTPGMMLYTNPKQYGGPGIQFCQIFP